MIKNYFFLSLYRIYRVDEFYLKFQISHKPVSVDIFGAVGIFAFEESAGVGSEWRVFSSRFVWAEFVFKY